LRQRPRWAQRTVAELHGNTDIAAWLLAHGAHDELSRADRSWLPALAQIARRGSSVAAPARPANRSCGPSTTLCFIPAENGNVVLENDARVRL